MIRPHFLSRFFIFRLIHDVVASYIITYIKRKSNYKDIDFIMFNTKLGLI